MNTTYLRHAAGYPRSSLRLRFAIAFFAVVVSATLVGGVLGLFEMQSDAAMIAKLSVPAAATVVVEATTDPIPSTSIDGPGRG